MGDFIDNIDDGRNAKVKFELPFTRRSGEEFACFFTVEASETRVASVVADGNRVFEVRSDGTFRIPGGIERLARHLWWLDECEKPSPNRAAWERFDGLRSTYTERAHSYLAIAFGVES